MKRSHKLSVIAVALAGLLFTTAGACDSESEQDDPIAAGNYDAQKKAVPIPQLQDSLERRNITEHLKRNNQADRIRYIYLISDVGTVFSFHTIKGKVTSTGAQLTPTDDFAKPCTGCDRYVVQGPTDDGSFGGDEGGIYFFTAEGDEVQWNGKWLVLDKPRKIDESSLALKE